MGRSARAVWQGSTLKMGVGAGDLFTLMSIPMLGILFALSLFSEGLSPMYAFFGDILMGGSERLLWVFASALNATVLNFAGLKAIESFGASTVHLIGNIKILLTIWAANLFLDESVSSQQFVGTVLSACGLVLFQLHRAHRSQTAVAKQKTS